MVNEIEAADYLEKGTAYAVSGNQKKASVAFKKVIALRPNKAALIKRLQRDIDREIEMYQQKKGTEVKNKIQKMIKSGKKPSEINAEVGKDLESEDQEPERKSIMNKMKKMQELQKQQAEENAQEMLRKVEQQKMELMKQIQNSR